MDDSLNKACQWFSEIMASADKNRSGHKVSEFLRGKPYPKRNTMKQRIEYFGWTVKGTDPYEVTSLDTVSNPSLLGTHFALLWSSSKTHEKPFYSRRSKKVGFGVAKAKSGTRRYYSCAIFSNN